jgi:hypothetical protein
VVARLWPPVIGLSELPVGDLGLVLQPRFLDTPDKGRILYFTNFGPIRYIDDDDNTVGFLDWQGVLKAAEEGRAKIAQ